MHRTVMMTGHADNRVHGPKLYFLIMTYEY